VSRTVKLDVVELLKQVLEWTPLYRPGLNRGLIQAAKIGSSGCVKVSVEPILYFIYNKRFYLQLILIKLIQYPTFANLIISA